MLEELALASPSFSAMPPTTTSAQLPPGWRTNFPVPYGDARCDAGAATGPPPEARARVRTSDGTAHAVALSLAGDSEDLERVRARDCAQHELRRAVRLSLEGWVLDGEELRGALVLRRAQSRDAVAVESFGGNVIYTIRAGTPATTPLVTLAAGQSEATLPVRVEATRCDPHALAESKQSYVFRLYSRSAVAPPS